MTPPHPLLRRLPALGLAAWVAGAVLLWVVGRRRLWSPGELVLAGGVWVLVLAVLAREPVRNLFGPVFWYEITRVGRRFTTFLFRFLYVLLVCGLLTLLYLSWWSRMSRGSDPTRDRPTDRAGRCAHRRRRRRRRRRPAPPA